MQRKRQKNVNKNHFRIYCKFNAGDAMLSQVFMFEKLVGIRCQIMPLNQELLSFASTKD